MKKVIRNTMIIKGNIHLFMSIVILSGKVIVIILSVFKYLLNIYNNSAIIIILIFKTQCYYLF